MGRLDFTIAAGRLYVSTVQIKIEPRGVVVVKLSAKATVIHTHTHGHTHALRR